MNSKRTIATVAAILLAVATAGCSVGNQFVTPGAMCIFHANETFYVGQPCDPNGSITLVWDNGTQKAVSGVWNEEARGDPPCSVFPSYITSGTVVPGGAVGSTVLELDSPSVPDKFKFEGFLSSDGKRLEGVMDTIPFEAKGETTCTCRR